MEEHCNLPGQISLFDLPEITITNHIIEKPKEIPDKNEIEKEITEVNTKINKGLTIEQRKLLDKFIGDESVLRIIYHFFGRISVEIKDGNRIKTIHYDEEGKKFFEGNNQATVLPKDKILYYKKQLSYDINELQLNRLEEVKCRYNTIRLLHRRGDYNILVEHENGVVSINPKGWILEFELVKKIDCTDEEVMKLNSIKNEEGN